MRLEPVDYETLCEPVALDQLRDAEDGASHRIAYVEPERKVQPREPTDIAGVVERHLAAGVASDMRGAAKAMPENWWRAPWGSPPLYVASLRDVTCFGGRIQRRARGRHDGGHLLVVDGRHLVPDSHFVRDGTSSLPRDCLATDEATGALSLTQATPTARRAGTYLLLGGAHKHFGHFVLEGLSRLWALPELHPATLDGVVVYQLELASWQYAMLEGAGIRREQVLCLSEPARFERLIVPSIALHLHRSISERMNAVWDPIAAKYGDRRSGRRFYVSRSLFTKRRELKEEARIEAGFRERGFEVVHPQHMPIAKQVAMAASADILAGSAGSGMYLGAFQPMDATKIIVSPRHFTLIDDHLISHVRRGRLVYYLSDDEDMDSAPGGRYRDYHVDVNHLFAGVEAMLSS